MNRRRALHGFVAAAALVVLLPLAAAQPTTPADHERDYAAAKAEYDAGHYAAAFAGFAALADAGHVESARLAMQMHRHGPSLYRMRFAVGPKQIGRWSALVSCRHQPLAANDPCLPISSGESSLRH